MNNCGNCSHWYRRSKQNHSIPIGDCDKIEKGTKFEQDKFEYDGYSFSDENYDDEFHCFE